MPRVHLKYRRWPYSKNSQCWREVSVHSGVHHDVFKLLL